MYKPPIHKRKLRKTLRYLQRNAIKVGIDGALLKRLNYICEVNHECMKKGSNRMLILAIISALLVLIASVSVVNSFLSARCLLPSNYLVWEATRPLADCRYCKNVTKPIILRNVSRDQFKKLYEETAGGYESFEDECQFLNFKTDLFSLKEVFDMPVARVNNEPGYEPWYIGWGNCHPDILSTMRQYYDVPDFLPEDAEFPATENIFLGFEIGAVMHLDYIQRLMWQGQVKGVKIWSIAPVPECDHVCHKFQYYVDPGDIVLLDTRIWYHATKIPKGQFSITVQSEYG